MEAEKKLEELYKDIVAEEARLCKLKEQAGKVEQKIASLKTLPAVAVLESMSRADILLLMRACVDDLARREANEKEAI